MSRRRRRSGARGGSSPCSRWLTISGRMRSAPRTPTRGRWRPTSTRSTSIKASQVVARSACTDTATASETSYSGRKSSTSINAYSAPLASSLAEPTARISNHTVIGSTQANVAAACCPESPHPSVARFPDPWKCLRRAGTTAVGDPPRVNPTREDELALLAVSSWTAGLESRSSIRSRITRYREVSGGSAGGCRAPFPTADLRVLG